MRIHQFDLADVLQSLPDSEKLGVGVGHELKVDLFICTLGFEDRTSCALTKLVEMGCLQNSDLVLIHYPTNEEDNSKHLCEFCAAAESMRGVVEFTYSRSTFLGQLQKIFGGLPPNASVMFDVSTCASYLFYPFMRFVFDLDIDLTIIYTEALEYHPTLEEWEAVEACAQKEGDLFVRAFEDADFQSLGVEDVYPYSIFSEMNAGNRPSALVAVPNFNPLRMNAIVSRDRDLNKTRFENILWILGEPPAHDKKWRADAVRRANDLMQVSGENLAMTSTFEYKKMLEALEGAWLRRRHKFQISVAPLGSKMQHLGTFIFLALHQEVSIWLAEPAKYQAGRFSHETADIWLIRLGGLQEFRSRLEAYMTFKWNS